MIASFFDFLAGGIAGAVLVVFLLVLISGLILKQKGPQ